jgi:hypothetical protein
MGVGDGRGNGSSAIGGVARGWDAVDVSGKTGVCRE